MYHTQALSIRAFQNKQASCSWDISWLCPTPTFLTMPSPGWRWATPSFISLGWVRAMDCGHLPGAHSTERWSRLTGLPFLPAGMRLSGWRLAAVSVPRTCTALRDLYRAGRRTAREKKKKEENETAAAYQGSAAERRTGMQ